MRNNNDYAKIGKYWSKQFSKKESECTDWWLNPIIVRHINKRVAGYPLDGLCSGLNSCAIDIAGTNLPFSHGVSVGCGTAALEIDLLCANFVKSFTVFDLSEYALNQGKKLASQKGVGNKIDFICGNAFNIAKEEKYFDFVYWNDSLHHMFDVDAAVRWSFDVLKTGGMFYMNEYVGPNRFQWTDSMLNDASLLRKKLPSFYLRPRRQSGFVGSTKQAIKSLLAFIGSKKFADWSLRRPNISIMKYLDPSEAADSERIIDSVKKYFPQAIITPTGGMVYLLALGNILQNFDETEDIDLLNELLVLDDSFTDHGVTLYATALAIKT